MSNWTFRELLNFTILIPLVGSIGWPLRYAQGNSVAGSGWAKLIQLFKIAQRLGEFNKNTS
jgi:hypothetical protein